MPSFPSTLDLDDPDESLVASYDVVGARYGAQVSVLGDVNGDGIDDLLVSVDVRPSYEEAWQNYVVFGTAGPPDALASLDDLDGTNGFRIENRVDWRGSVAIGAGDVNGDGIADIAMVSSQTDPDRAHLPYADVHVIYGGTGGHDGNIAIDDLDGTNGFTLTGPTDDRAVYYRVAQGGDIDGDGFDDLAIFRTNARAHFLMGSGDVMAASTPLNSVSPLSNLTGFGQEGVGLGDLNGDGYDEVLVGHNIYYGRAADAETQYDRGPFADRISYVENLSSSSLVAFAAAGDVNGDGFDDFIYGDGYDEPSGHSRAGAAYVVFGRAAGVPTYLDGADLNGKNGFAIRGDYGDMLGSIVAGGVDINGDGFDDVVAYSQDDDIAYVVYGKASYHTAGFDIDDIGGTNGFVIENAGDEWTRLKSIAGVGDITGDGLGDLVFTENPGSGANSEFHVLAGRLPTEAVTRVDGKGNNTVWGGAFDDIIISFAGDDRLIGGDGNDSLRSVDGSDTMEGGLGDDEYFVFADHSDTIIDTGGIDTIRTTTHWDLSSYADIENVVLATAGDWHVRGNELDNRITGSFGNNVLMGMGGDDILIGGGGDDLLIGGNAADTMTGGEGSDRFDFRSLSEVGVGIDRDTITDFVSGEDLIGLGRIDADLGHSGNQAFHIVEAFSGAAGELAIRQQDGKTLVDADVDGDGLSDFQIELYGLHTLTAGDFIL
jgi:hypothetical protein